MDLSVTDLVEELKFRTRMQETSVPVTDEEYATLIKYAIRSLFVDTQRSSVYNKNLYYEQDGNVYYPVALKPIEEEYVMLTAMEGFYTQVASSYMGLMNYTTDALSVQHADKPYQNAKSSIEDTQARKRVVYYKMVDLTLPYIAD